MRKAVLAAVLGVILVGLIGGSLARAGDGDKKGHVKVWWGDQGHVKIWLGDRPNDRRVLAARLDGYQETPSISTVASGEMVATIESDKIVFKLTYKGLEGGAASAAHLHLAQRHVPGGVIAFLCGGGGKPACPATAGTVEGTLVAADVIGPAAQGIAAGQFDELARALRAGAVYVNMHTPTYPNGEIRGQLGDRFFHDDDGDD